MQNKNGVSKRLNALWNTYHCQNLVVSTDRKFYCKDYKTLNYTLCCSIVKSSPNVYTTYFGYSFKCLIPTYIPSGDIQIEPHWYTLVLQIRHHSNIHMVEFVVFALKLQLFDIKE